MMMTDKAQQQDVAAAAAAETSKHTAAVVGGGGGGGMTRSRSPCSSKMLPITPSQKSPAGKKSRFNSNTNNNNKSVPVAPAGSTAFLTLTTTVVATSSATAADAHLITPATATTPRDAPAAALLVSIKEHHDDDDDIQSPSTADDEKNDNDDGLEDSLIAQMKGLVIHWKDLFREAAGEEESNPEDWMEETAEVQTAEEHYPWKTATTRPRNDDDDLSSSVLRISGDVNTAAAAVHPRCKSRAPPGAVDRDHHHHHY
jgi:hypothetical protein